MSTFNCLLPIDLCMWIFRRSRLDLFVIFDLLSSCRIEFNGMSVFNLIRFRYLIYVIESWYLHNRIGEGGIGNEEEKKYVRIQNTSRYVIEKERGQTPHLHCDWMYFRLSIFGRQFPFSSSLSLSLVAWMCVCAGLGFSLLH